MMYPVLAPPIANVQIPIWRNRYASGFIEISVLVHVGEIGHPECPHDATVQGNLRYNMAPVVRNVDICSTSFTTQSEAVGPLGEFLSPRSDEIPVTVENDHCVFALVENVHAILKVHHDAASSTEGYTLRQLLPAFNDLVGVRVVTKTHGLFFVSYRSRVLTSNA
jgi:hypothetical protein